MLFIAAMPMASAYNANDVTAMNAIIAAHPELGLTAGQPSMWSPIVEWDGDSTDNRIIKLNMGNRGLAGELDVTGLTMLEELRCSDNQLTTLNAAGLTNLKHLSCNHNQLTTLDVTTLTNLEYLLCSGNQLTTLDVATLTNLKVLSCVLNQLTTLDLTQNSNLEELYCRNNPLRTLQLPDNPGLSVWADPLLKRSSGSGTGSATIVDSNRIIPQTPAQNTNQPQEQTQNEVQQNVPQNQPEQQEQTQPPTSNEEQKENNNSLILMIGLAALIVLGVAGFVIYQRNKK